jgi:hypothetical protein
VFTGVAQAPRNQKDTTMQIFPTRLLRSATGLAASAALVFLLAGCAPSAGGSDTTEGSGGATPTDEASFSAARDAYDLKLAECLRGKGLDVKDPEPGMGIQESSEEINAAASICMQEIGDPPVYESPLSDTELHEVYLALAECYRDLGYEVVDPRIGEAFVIPETATDADMAACSDTDR